LEIRKLNTLRGLAALIVLITHFSDVTGWLGGSLGGRAGQYGVMLFFLLRNCWGHVFLCSINLFVILYLMARQIRIEYPGAIYHITSRGNAQQPIFETKAYRKGY